MVKVCEFCGKKLDREDKRFCNLDCCYDWQRKHGGFAKGRIVSRKTRKKLSKSLTGKKYPPRSQEWKDKVSQRFKGKKKTLEHRRKLSESKKGKSLTPEHRRAIGRGMKGQKFLLDRIGNGNPNWKGGRCLAPHGYISILMSNHPSCNSKGRMLEHRVIIEEHLGRYLKASEMVHHIDFDKQNNKIENLYLTTLKHNSLLNKQVHRLMKDLIKKGIVLFDRKFGKYYIK